MCLERRGRLLDASHLPVQELAVGLPSWRDVHGEDTCPHLLALYSPILQPQQLLSNFMTSITAIKNF